MKFCGFESLSYLKSSFCLLISYLGVHYLIPKLSRIFYSLKHLKSFDSKFTQDKIRVE